MQTHMVHSRPCGLPCGRHSVSTGSRQAVVALAKRKGGVSKELRELQQLKDSPAPTATASSPAPIPPASPAAPPPATGAPSSSPPPSTSASTWATSSGGSSSAPSSSNPSSSSGSSAATSGGSGLFDNLLIRILASVTAIMAVISVFYSIVFYGASNAVYIFKDQLAAITKKDFVPYSERRRLEQVDCGRGCARP
ncbi:hypothetical protein PLESTB_001689200 [Pleodorina starrii]|uniref:Uncharacterized protein n=1 Tax=Pleodorina starrii TaxID=330485 RepID=A0A9W6F9N5_9CHLO|nr:hypothetical protein PLESTM_001662100 [Pleodorina starrii]GLC60900.1 hypothetical protein PLESTB_001689200 [Pleodorina starrii]